MTGIIASLCTRICFNRGTSTNLLHLTLVITATVCCWMMWGNCVSCSDETTHSPYLERRSGGALPKWINWNGSYSRARCKKSSHLIFVCNSYCFGLVICIVVDSTCCKTLINVLFNFEN
ncbi:uncharacterized protein LOC130761230 isoform X3 [Actinidia eriantha]|uniref:uncharacterized protein LOC130761230 isoform X3 n=1 Tax=Actinidia eriantha TaxID=165200 RepID=UPI00258B78F7|nr:uncharacterized protein LOC130761230 isoform X3 [Actinidia eriantha]